MLLFCHLCTCSSGVAWLGLVDEDGDDHWVWEADGEPMTYERWMRGQPDTVGVERCVRIINTNGDWANTRCVKTFPVICMGGKEGERERLPSSSVISCV